MMRHPAILLVALLCCGLFPAAAAPVSAETTDSAAVRGERPLLVERIRPERPHWDNHYGGDRRRPAWNHRRDHRRHARPPYGYAPPPPPPPYYGAPYGYGRPPQMPGYPFGYDPRHPRPDYPFGYDPRGRAPRYDSPYQDYPRDYDRHHRGGGWI